MLESLLPHAVVVEELRHDDDAPLTAVEAAAVRNAVPRRRDEFASGRACARRALARLGHPASEIPKGAHGEPCWPAGIVGSITHCEGFRACALASAHEIASIGLDAEPNAPLPAGVVDDVAHERERSALQLLAHRRPDVCWDRLLFSAKESIYKLWFPLAGCWLGFEDARVALAPDGRFTACLLLPPAALPDPRLALLRGRWRLADGLLLTAIVLTPQRPATTAA